LTDGQKGVVIAGGFDLSTRPSVLRNKIIKIYKIHHDVEFYKQSRLSLVDKNDTPHYPRHAPVPAAHPI
jgi:hypothetical protein